jgi:hypothetical protein
MQTIFMQIMLGNITSPFSPSFEGNEELRGKKITESAEHVIGSW